MKNRTLALLGQQIRHLREEKGLSQEEFAGLAHMDRAYYGGIERGERNVAALNLIRIADALDLAEEERLAILGWRRISDRVVRLHVI